MPSNRPVPLSKDELVTMLADVLDGVRSGDTLEGSIEFLQPFDTGAGGEPPDADFMVIACYRTGNTAGRDGVRVVGHMTATNPVELRLDG